MEREIIDTASLCAFFFVCVCVCFFSIGVTGVVGKGRGADKNNFFTKRFF